MTWQERLTRLEALLHRFPWLLPAISFAGGWLGFIMVQRGANAAQIIAMLAIVGWLWLLIEPLLRRRLERSRPGIGNLFVNFISQSLQQELPGQRAQGHGHQVDRHGEQENAGRDERQGGGKLLPVDHPR